MRTGIITSFLHRLSEKTDPYILGLFRIAFGIAMAYTMIRYLRIGLARNMFTLPLTNFQYDFLEWLSPMPENYMNGLIGILLLCALAITTGLWFKWACRIFALGYAYLFLLDKSIYNNHIYLFILLAVLLSLTDADRVFSMRRNRSTSFGVPRWQVFILQLQIVIVYFYGGIAKLTKDWLLNCQPVRLLVDQFPVDHLLAPLIKHELGVYVLNYGGLLIDLGAPLLLWYKPLRKWAVFLYISFNLLNSRIFTDIGIFPYLMLVSLLLFFESRELPFIKNLVNKKPFLEPEPPRINAALHAGKINRSGSVVFLYIYFLFQFVFPLRGHFLPNDQDWTTIGNRFSWRMKVDTREIEAMNFFIHSPTYAEPVPIDIKTFVNDMQILNLAMDPRSIADFAKALRVEAEKHNAIDPIIKATIRVKYNGRPTQEFINSEVDLTTAEANPFHKIEWVYPIKD